MLAWSILMMAALRIDHWAVNLLFGSITIALGVIVSMSGSASIDQEKKEARNVGLVLVAVGMVVTLLEAYDRFVIGSMG